jgi:hypothetical protein
MEGSPMKLNVQGQTVEVDDSFGQLSPAEQAAQVEEIGKTLGFHNEAAAEKQATAEQTAQPAGNFDLSNSQSATRQVIDPAIQAVSTGGEMLGHLLNNPIVQKGLEYGGGGYAAKRFLVNPVLDALKPVGQAVGQHVSNVTDALNRQAAAAEAHEAGVAQRAAARAGVPMPTAQAVPQVAPQMAQAATQTAAAAAPEEASFIQRGMQYAAQMRQIAAQKAMQGMQAMGPAVEAAAGRVGQMAAPIAEAAGVAGRALSAANPYITAAQGLTYSKDLGPAVPNKGPYRGMEINPRTNRPWTPQELAVINR